MRKTTNSRRAVAVAVAALVAAGALLAAPSATAGGGGEQRFLAVGTAPGEKAPVTLLGFGPIHAKGRDVVVNNHLDRFRFPNGSLLIRHHRVGKGHGTHDRATCLSTYREHGRYRITGGTGEYAAASGHGTYRVNVVAVACSRHKPPEVFYQTIKAHGPLSL